MSLTCDDTFNVSERGDAVHVSPPAPCLCVLLVSWLVLIATDLLRFADC